MTRRSNIAIDVRMLETSGIGTYLQNMVPRVIAARPAFGFVLVGSPPVIERHGLAQSPNVTVRSCEAPIYSVAEQWRIPAALPDYIDVYWTPHYPIPVLRRGPIVVSVHDMLHLAMPELVSGLEKRLYARWMFGHVRRRATAILFSSQFTASEFVRLAGMPRGSPHTIHLGISESWFRVRTVTRSRERPYLLYVGNVKPHKNVRALLLAFDAIRDEVPHDLVIVGQREGFITGDREVNEMAAAHPERVHFTGVVEGAVLEQYVASAAALVLPSLYEGFGLPPLEAMACGCPTIVSRAGSLPEVCGDAALYIDPHDPADLARAIRALVQQPELATDLRERGRRQAARFTWDRCAAQTLPVLDGLTAVAPEARTRAIR
ncbi:MAG TPA: glycosyltransferase family 1 protein [Gemmatimonadaceae bacterium]|nr:glycosyltransferase family 1 protein [Gemmatimonadaceae bacterium]